MKKSIISILILFVALLSLGSCSAFKEEKTQTTDGETMDKMQGFWVLAGYEGELNEKIKLSGAAIDIDGSSMDMYEDFFVIADDVGIDISQGNILVYKKGNKNYAGEISFKIQDGYEIMIFDSEEGYMQFERSSEDVFYIYKEFKRNENASYESYIYLEDELTDKELAKYIADAYWNEWCYLYPNGAYSEMDPYSMVLYSLDMSGFMEYVDETIYVGWEVHDGKLYLTYESGETYYFPIDYEFNNITRYAYLYLYDTEEGYEGCAWVLWAYVD